MLDSNQQSLAAVVTAKKQLSPKVWQINARTELPLIYAPGQYAEFLTNFGRWPMSFAAPSDGHALEFLFDVSSRSPAARFAFDSPVNASFFLIGPFGRFTLVSSDTRPVLFIATGTGIAPLRAQLLHELQSVSARPVTLLFGNQNPDYMFFLDEFEALAAAHPRFTFIPVSAKASSAWTGATGLVTDAVERMGPDIPYLSAYVCGSLAMVQAVAIQLFNLGLPPEHLHTEQPIPLASTILQ